MWSFLTSDSSTSGEDSEEWMPRKSRSPQARKPKKPTSVHRASSRVIPRQPRPVPGSFGRASVGAREPRPRMADLGRISSASALSPSQSPRQSPGSAALSLASRDSLPVPGSFGRASVGAREPRPRMADLGRISSASALSPSQSPRQSPGSAALSLASRDSLPVPGSFGRASVGARATSQCALTLPTSSVGPRLLARVREPWFGSKLGFSRARPPSSPCPKRLGGTGPGGTRPNGENH